MRTVPSAPLAFFGSKKGKDMSTKGRSMNQDVSTSQHSTEILQTPKIYGNTRIFKVNKMGYF